MIVRVLMIGMLLTAVIGGFLWLLVWTEIISREVIGKLVKNGLIVIAALVLAILAIQALVLVDKLF